MNNSVHHNIDPDNNYFGYVSENNDATDECPYYFSGDYNNLCTASSNNLRIVSFNVRSFHSNIDKLLLIFDNDFYPHILVLCETWFSSETVQDLPNYVAYHTLRPGSRGGGISIYVNKNLFSSPLQVFSYCTMTIEINTVKVEFGDDVLYILGVYRPHSDSINSFTDVFFGLLRDFSVNGKNVIIAGDFNINLMSNIDPIESFLNGMQAHHFLPKISKPTRFPNSIDNSPTLIDHIWFNSNVCVQVGIIAIDITDHCPIFMHYPYNNNSTLHATSIKIVFRNRNKINNDHFHNVISNFDWNLIAHPDVSDHVDAFLGTVNNIFCNSFPLQTKFISKKRFSKPWMNSYLFNLIKMKSRYFKLFRRGLVSNQDNNFLKNKINSAIRKARLDFYYSAFQKCKNNIRKTWDTIRNILSITKNKNTVKCLLFNNIEHVDAHNIAKIFNEYFSKVPNTLNSNIPPSDTDPLSYVNFNQSSIFLHPVSNEECSSVIRSLKNSKTGLNSLPVQLLKNECEYFSPVLTSIANNSFSSGIFPKSLKTACVTPILKKGDKKIVSNYRPISVVHYASKILEKLIQNRLHSFLHRFNIISENQFGFRRGKSTQDALIKLVDYFYDSLESKEFSAAIFVDYQKAFDTVNHHILLQKLEAYGIRGMALKLFESYLTDRRQFVRIGEACSEESPCNIGVPQGTILAPLLFTLYINDLNNISNEMSLILFADDTTLLFRNPSYDQLLETCNSELVKYRKWTICNRLSLNIDKTHVFIVSNRKIQYQPELYYGDMLLSVKRECLFLGVLIDDSLKFGNHIKNLSSKISKSAGILFKLNQFTPPKVMRGLYFSLVYPYLTYCNTVWGTTFNTHLQPLIRAQKRIIRIINKEPFLAHTSPLFRKLSILKFEDINYYFVSVYMYKNSNSFETTSSHGYSTRQSVDLRTSLRRTALTQHSIFYVGPKIWNTLPLDIRNLENLNTFKRNLNIYLLSKYPLET